jgi:hypothetical protein
MMRRGGYRLLTADYLLSSSCKKMRGHSQTVFVTNLKKIKEFVMYTVGICVFIEIPSRNQLFNPV